MRPMNGVQCFIRQGFAFSGHAKLAEKMKSMGEIRDGLPRSVTSRKIHAGQRRVIRTDPAAQCNLRDERDQADYSNRPDAAQARGQPPGQLQMSRGQPCQQGHQSHAAEQVQRDDNGLEQQGHGPFAE